MRGVPRGSALALVALLAACNHTPPPVPGTPAVPVAGYLSRGELQLRVSDGARDAWLAARWTVDDEPDGYRVAQLDVAPAPAGDVPPPAARLVALQGRQEWDDLLREVLTALAPLRADEAAVVAVQGRDVAFHRDETGALRFYPHEQKPAAVRVMRVIRDGEFSAVATAHIRAKGGTQPQLYATGNPGTGDGYVLIDPVDATSVLIAPVAAPNPAKGTMTFGTSINFAQALLLQSHVVAPVAHPLESTGRLVTHAAQSVVAALPRTAPAAGAIVPLATAAPMDPAAFAADLDRLVASRAMPGTMRLLIDGEAFFPRFVQAVQDARESVDVRVYIFDRDDYALRIADLLRARSDDVRVRVLTDALGSIGAADSRVPYPYDRGPAATPVSIQQYLEEGSKVQVRVQPNPFLTSDHTKVIVVDGAIAFVGGMNIGYEYRYVWHDLMVEVDGAIAERLARDFDAAWARAVPGFPAASDASASGTPAALLAGIRPLYTRPGDPEILRAQLAAIRAARQRIWIEQAYVSDDAIVAALVQARRRGVDVRVVLPTRGDSGFMNSANVIAARTFLRNGIRVYAYPGMTHVKAALYDGWAVVGSANFDKLSLRVNGETNLSTFDPAFTGALRKELFDRDFARSRELTEPPRAGWTTYLSDFIADQL
jgi:cardiolipin synthase